MKTMIFTVYDSKTAAYMQPFYSLTKPSAIRSITDAVNQPEHQFYKYAEDFSLFYLGQYDDVDSIFDLTASPIHLCGLHELRQAHQLPPLDTTRHPHPPQLQDPSEKEASNG